MNKHEKDDDVSEEVTVESFMLKGLLETLLDIEGIKIKMSEVNSKVEKTKVICQGIKKIAQW